LDEEKITMEILRLIQELRIVNPKTSVIYMSMSPYESGEYLISESVQTRNLEEYVMLMTAIDKSAENSFEEQIFNSGIDGGVIQEINN